MLMLWGENDFMWLLIVVVLVAKKISKNLHISVNFFVRCDPVRVYVVVIA